MPNARLAPFLSLLLVPALSAQDEPPSALDAALDAAAEVAVEALKQGVTQFAADIVREKMHALVDAFGTRPERRANEILLGWIERKGPKLVHDDPQVQELLDEVAFQRARGRPERLLLPLLALRATCPDDPRVLYALGEAFGVASVVFDAKESASAFRSLLPLLRDKAERAEAPDERTRLLSVFLPELAAAGVLPRAKNEDVGYWLRQQVLGFLETLDAGRPIGIWQLADPRLDNLYEELVVQRRKGDQAACVRVLEVMLAMQRSHPVHLYALAEARASLGPMFDPNKAIESLDEFLDLTDAATVGSAGRQREPLLSRDQLAAQIERFRVADPRDGLEAQRVFARELKAALVERPEEPWLLAPDRTKLAAEVAKLSSQVSQKAKEIEKVEAHLRKNREGLERLRATRHDPADPNRKNERIQDFNEEIDKDETKLAKLRPDHDEKKALLDRLRARLDRFR